MEAIIFIVVDVIIRNIMRAMLWHICQGLQAWLQGLIRSIVQVFHLSLRMQKVKSSFSP